LRIGQPLRVRCFSIAPDWHEQPWADQRRVSASTILPLLVTGLFGFMAIVACYAVFVAPEILRRLVRYGRATKGRIMDRTVRRGSTTSYCVHYQYEVSTTGREVANRGSEANGMQITGTHWVSRQDYDHAEPGFEVIVLYDARRPRRSLIYDYSEWEVA
jgi:hypothetical protein